MSVSHFGLRQLLARWFRNGSMSEAVETEARPEQPARLAGSPVFSLGDTKQDVVVSYRRETTES